MPLPKRINIDYLDIPGKTPGQVSYEAIVSAVSQLHAGDGQALVTGPIAKDHLVAAGYPMSGHTEILETFANQLYQPEKPFQAEMLFMAPPGFRLLLLTRHLPLSQVPSALATMDLMRPVETAITHLITQAGIPQPRLVWLGLNPHAGEVGGEEEARFFQPAIASLQARYPVTIDGPVAADGFFRGFRPETSPYDLIISPYHDQGLIPFKLLAGYQAVNVTLGLPFIRTSVSHGTAFDIAGQGQASAESLHAAVAVALQLGQAGS